MSEVVLLTLWGLVTVGVMQIWMIRRLRQRVAGLEQHTFTKRRPGPVENWTDNQLYRNYEEVVAERWIDEDDRHLYLSLLRAEIAERGIGDEQNW